MVQCDNGPSYKSKVMSKTKDKRGTTRTDDERGQENQGTDTASVETPGLLKKRKINTRRSVCPSPEPENERDRCVALPHECTREREAELVHERS